MSSVVSFSISSAKTAIIFQEQRQTVTPHFWYVNFELPVGIHGTAPASMSIEQEEGGLVAEVGWYWEQILVSLKEVYTFGSA